MRRTITTPRSRSTSSSLIYQLKISLEHSDPLIWRRILIPASFKLDRVHDVIQIAMGWEDYHLHQFVIDGKRYTAVHDELSPGDVNETTVRLHKVAPRPGMKFEYEYDFGDGWIHQITVESILPVDPNARYPRCIDGERAGPPEDCGGIWGYLRLLEALKDPRNPEYAELLEWIGEEFDPGEFDLDAVNAQFGSMSKS